MSVMARRNARRAGGSIGPAVRIHRSARPRSSALAGTGISARSRGMNVSRRALQALAAGMSAPRPKTTGIVVVAVGAPGQPAGRQVKLLGGGVGVDARRAQRQVGRAQLALVPHALAEDAHVSGPVHVLLAGGVEVRAEGERERHVDRRVLEVADRLEGDVGEAAQPLRRGRRERERDACALRARSLTGRREPAPPGRHGAWCTWMTAGATRDRPTASPAAPSRKARPESAPPDQCRARRGGRAAR